jgi:hypothetical protein
MTKGVPDFKYINRNIPVKDVARVLGLQFGSNGNIHCWRPELHQHGDRTASVGIRRTNNTTKCFGCGTKPLGPLDLVMAVLEIKQPLDADRWIAEHFDVPAISLGKHIVAPPRLIHQVGFESPMGILIRSGLFCRLSLPTRAIAPVIVEFAERRGEGHQRVTKLSYRAITRYSGIKSSNAISKALAQLEEIGWLEKASGSKRRNGVIQETTTLILTPGSDLLQELANQNAACMKDEIEREREARKDARQERSKKGRPERALTK